MLPNTTNRSALTANTALPFDRGGALLWEQSYPKYQKINVVGELATRYKEVLRPYMLPNTANRSALTANTALPFNRGRSALWEQSIRSAENLMWWEN